MTRLQAAVGDLVLVHDSCTFAGEPLEFAWLGSIEEIDRESISIIQQHETHPISISLDYDDLRPSRPHVAEAGVWWEVP